MQVVRHILIIALLMILSGCSGSDVCSAGANATSSGGKSPIVLTDYCAYKRSLRKPGPPLGALAEPLGRRGRDAVVVWVEDMETHYGLYKNWEYGPILSYARYYTGYRICSDPELLKRAKAGFLGYYRGIRDEKATSMIVTYC